MKVKNTIKSFLIVGCIGTALILSLSVCKKVQAVLEGRVQEQKESFQNYVLEDLDKLIRL